MSRRRQDARTDETTLSEGLRRNVKLEGIANLAGATGLPIEELLLEEKDNYLRTDEEKYFSKPEPQDSTTPLDVLKRTLSVRSVLSTNSSFAERMEALRNANPENLKLAEIGRGSFGTVYEIPGTLWCLKKTLGAPKTLWEEYVKGSGVSTKVNQRAWNAIIESGNFPNDLMPRVPQYLCSYGMSDGGKDTESLEEWFEKNGHRFPVENGGQKSGPVICLERIMPLTKVIRENLIRQYFKPEELAEALVEQKNKACICRPYLGCTTQEVEAEKRQKECQTLQNFPLYLDQLMELDMAPFTIARDMALGLAAGHWAANINMLDVEYVIGSRPHTPAPPTSSVTVEDRRAVNANANQRVRNMGIAQPVREQGLSFRNRSIQLWMIDFNKVSRFDPSVSTKDYKRNVEQLVFDTRSTDGPYYPRVLARTRSEWNLWLEFAQTYIDASKAILDDRLQNAKDTGITVSRKQEDLIRNRPSLVINEWIKAEALEYNVSSKEFRKMLVEKGWKLPGGG